MNILTVFGFAPTAFFLAGWTAAAAPMIMVSSGVTGLHQKRVFTSLGSSCPQCVHHILLLSAHAYMHFLLKWDPMRTPKCDGVHIGSHFHKNAYMHELTTIGIHKEEVPKLVYTLFWCKPVVYIMVYTQHMHHGGPVTHMWGSICRAII